MSAVGDPEELESELGYRFTDRVLLLRSLTHSSHAHEQRTGEDNEQLEFLGDSILGFVVSDALFRRYPEFSEGELSKLKSFFVSSANLVKYAEKLQLGRYLRLGKGEEKTGGRAKQALLVDAFEALLGAIFLDGGMAASQSIVSRFMEAQIAEIGELGDQFTDFKTALQERIHEEGTGMCRYSLVNESGPDHQKLFTVEVELGGDIIARGVGLTRRAAEQAAAKQALEAIQSK